jgi:AraC-like DNA-binding protein
MQVLSFISLLGAAAAMLLAARLMFAPTENRPAARALAAFLFCAALFVADNVCYNEAAFARFPWFYAVANPFILALGPTFFLYCSAATQPGFAWSWRKFLHFIPSLLWAALDASTYLMSAEEKVRQSTLDHTETPWHVILILTLYLDGYIGTTCWRLWRHRQRIAEQQEEGLSHPVRGLFPLACVLFAILIASAIGDFAGWAATSDTIIAFATVLGVFSLLWAFTQPRHLVVPLPVATTVPVPAAPATAAGEAPVSAEPPAPATPRLETVPENDPPAAASLPPAEPAPEATAPRLPPAETARIAKRVRELFERDEIHLEPTLSLQVLAERAKATRHNVSYVLREEFGATFYQLVASYRVRSAAAALRADTAGSRTIADIAFASGFNTLSAFNAAFRAQFGVTPSVFREKSRAESPRQAVA